MSNDMVSFGNSAKNLARNPLGIIALFLVLVYGFACLVTAFGRSFTPQQETPLIWFLVVFPVLVLGVFGWLVSQHSGKLFAPADFKNEDNYVKMQMSAAAALSLASTKSADTESTVTVGQVVELVQQANPKRALPSEARRRQILWVDDNPRNNIYERDAFESVGISFSLAESTDEALRILSNQSFAAIISDMGRREGPREGYVLLDRLRETGNNTPLFFYAGSNSPKHKEETRRHGGQGCTNDPRELFHMVTSAVLREEREI